MFRFQYGLLHTENGTLKTNNMLPLNETFAAIKWWLALLILGTAVLPLTFTLLKRLPDRGYAFVKMVGLLLVSYVFWLLGSLGFVGNNLGGILVGLLTAVILSWLAYRRDGAELRVWLRQNWRQVLLTELVFAVAFAFWVWVRSQNPAIAATEKPMEFAFLNSVGRSPAFPPNDPWLSGFGISYYYFGYVMVSLLARLTAIPEAIAFNLGVAWLFAGTAVGAFGLVYNLIAVYRDAAHPHIRRWAVTLGIVAAMAIPLIGNMQVALEALHGWDAGSPQFWAWLDVRDINNPPNPAAGPRFEGSNWWWWRSSRVINEYNLAGQQIDPEPIAEFPNFSFILGDMHPHVLVLPFIFLSLAVAFVWWRGGDQFSVFNVQSSETRNPSRITHHASRNTNLQFTILNSQFTIQWPFFLLTVLILGGLSFLNTWDVLIHLFVVAGAYFLAQWRREGLHRQIWTRTILLSVLLVIPAILLYLPFYLSFRSQAGPPFILPMLMRPTRLPQFLIMFGLPLTAVLILLLSLAVKQRFRFWQKGLATAVLLILGLFLLAGFLAWVIAGSSEGAIRVINLANELRIALPPHPGGVAFGWGLTAVFAILPAYLQNRLAFPGVTLLLGSVITLVVMFWHGRFSRTDKAIEPTGKPARALPFVLLLIGTGALLTLGPEFVYLKDNFGVRLNTVFKFYYQAWILLGISAVFALFYLWYAQRRVAAGLATAVYAIGFILALMFPFYAIQSRAVEYRGPKDAVQRRPSTLDGLAQMALYNPDEYAAILWLKENAGPDDVVLEAVGGQYSNYARVSVNSGVPTPLGWAGHEFQWRGTSTDEPGRRGPLVKQIYTSANWEEAAPLLDELGVTYIFVGSLENEYGRSGLQKFDDLEVAYQSGSVTIYRWSP